MSERFHHPQISGNNSENAAVFYNSLAPPTAYGHRSSRGAMMATFLPTPSCMLRCHDWGLEGYSVTDYGRTVTLHLISNYPGTPVERLDTVFSDVALYHFTHTQATIILDIEKIPVETILEEYSDQIVEWNRLHGVSHWPKSIEGYANMLKEKGCQGWIVSSSMGFEGFVLGEAVSQSPR